MVAPDGLVAAESVPQLAALQPLPERVQATPLDWGSLATVAATNCLWPSKTEKAAGARVTDMDCGGGADEVGGSLGEGELPMRLLGTEAHPPTKTANKSTSTGMGMRATTARTLESESKVEVLR
jgi:hypothetical protein